MKKYLKSRKQMRMFGGLDGYKKIQKSIEIEFEEKPQNEKKDDEEEQVLNFELNKNE
jgi:hypothetical protein